jgi:hypothetical protein
VPSADATRLAGVSFAVAAAATSVAGCVTTQQVASRVRLVDARIRAEQTRLRVGFSNPDVRVIALSELESAGGTAIVAELRNTSPRAQTDLPVALTVRARGGTRYLNGAANTNYVDNHLVAIPPHGSVTWIFTSRRRLRTLGRPFVRVGTSQIGEPSIPALPRLQVEPAGAADTQVSATVANRSGIPQYDVPIYAVASAGGRVRAAGRTTVTQLDSSATIRVRLKLIGRTAGTTLRLTTIPTIFR